MGSRLSYRESSKPKKGNAKYYRKQGVRVYLYRDENGVEKIKITKYFKRGRNPDYVENNQNDQQLLQDSEQN